jgi:hypothetical protein
MANLTSQQIKDSYQSVLTTSDTGTNPTTGTLQNGKGTSMTAITVNGTVNATTVNSGTVNSTNLTGTLGTPAQPNVTSTGALTAPSLTTPGAVSATGTVTGSKIIPTGGDATGNGMYLPSTNEIAWSTNGIERMRMKSDGNLILGSTSTDFGSGSGIRVARTSNNATVRVQRLSTSISQVELRAGASQGELFTVNNVQFVMGTGGTDRLILETGGSVRPGANNTQQLGNASFRWSEVFAGNGVINTSDANEKTDIEELNDAEHAVAVQLKGLIRKFRFRDSVERKGDDARIHVGVIAQDVAEVFTNAGLDPNKYGVFCEDVWHTHLVDSEDDPEIKIEKPCGPDDEGAIEHRILGIRYDQLFAFVISAL